MWTALTPKTHNFLGFSLQRSQKVRRLRSCMEMQIPVKSWPLCEVGGRGVASVPISGNDSCPQGHCECGQEPCGMPSERGRAGEGGQGGEVEGGGSVGRTFSEYTAGAPRGLRTSRLGPAYVCSRLAPWRWRSVCRTLDSLRYTSEARSSRRSQEGALACGMGQTGGHRRSSRSGRPHQQTACPAQHGPPLVPSTSLRRTFSTSSSSTSRTAPSWSSFTRSFPSGRLSSLDLS